MKLSQAKTEKIEQAIFLRRNRMTYGAIFDRLGVTSAEMRSYQLQRTAERTLKPSRLVWR